ncbi:FAD-NAD(P)-binding protein [Enterobacter asburiae]|uniref:FAD-NAD(P)-binding protein n=1 Tax=Scandinavium sp. UTDF21-P1B TaxID=3446379 RepID=UPI003490F4A6
MKKIAIIGTGPTGIYTFFSLYKHNTPVAISLYERAEEAGVGMPYADEDNSRLMLANIASIEIPPLFMTYLEWLKTLPQERLAHFGVEASTLHDRQFLPRILLGDYFRAQFLILVEKARQRGYQVEVHESCEVSDLHATEQGVRLWINNVAEPDVFDLAVIATGHVWPDDEEATRSFFPSPWSGLLEARIPAGCVGIMGLSLSAIDAAMAVVAQHGAFDETDEHAVTFNLNRNSTALNLTLMSRSGILPEADFYCPLPYEPLKVVTEQAVAREIAAGSQGLLDRIFALMAKEITLADPQWSDHITLPELNADTFASAWFADRQQHNPFDWAEENLREVERNKQERHTVPWRYAILRLHEAVEDAVAHFDERDRQRFNAGLARVFIDNYTAIPSESIRRLLALREAGILTIQTLGENYSLEKREDRTRIRGQNGELMFDTFIDARGQKPLKIKDLPFPHLREQLAATGDDFPNVAEDYTLPEPEALRGRIAFGALPYLMHDKPFIQGIVVCAEIGERIAETVTQPTSRLRRRLPFIER